MSNTLSFADLGLPQGILDALTKVGYETPSPIQAETIPPLLEGKDLLGQAQTGTGKTAAFALPVLSNLDTSINQPQVLVLTPTRELAIQVAEAIQTYAQNMGKVQVLAIYGGQAYEKQLRPLKRGVQVVVGTPGRVMDHLRRGTLKTEHLKTLVLDEADEMLRMGFIDDVEWILEQLPTPRQTALFSATMPKVIKNITQRYLTDPVHIKIETKTVTASNIKQYYWDVSGLDKTNALIRILEGMDHDAVITFVRTKQATEELADELAKRGFKVRALNGDIPQGQREKIVDQLRDGQFDILMATDVVARGLDVKRISHVINYDIPYDTESYIHRIGRTGRAGRDGEAILFVRPREKRLLRAIEKTTKQPIEAMKLPTVESINERRISMFKQRILDGLDGTSSTNLYQRLISELEDDTGRTGSEIAAVLASMLNGKNSLLLEESDHAKPKHKKDNAKNGRDANPRERRERSDRSDRSERPPRERGEHSPRVSDKALPLKAHPDIDMQRYRIQVGRNHEVTPGQIVGAIANEAEIDSQYIGYIKLFDDFSTVDLPSGMPKEVLQVLKKTRLHGQAFNINAAGSPGNHTGKAKNKPDSNGGKKPKKSSKKHLRDKGKPRRKNQQT